MDESKEKIRSFILENFLEGETSGNLHNTARLRTSGLLDSLATLGLISFMEKEFDLEFSSLELTVDNFDTIDQMVSLLDKRRKTLSEMGLRASAWGEPR